MALKKSELYASLWRGCDELRGGMDEELAALESRLAKTHALKQARMQSLLTGRIRLV